MVAIMISTIAAPKTLTKVIFFLGSSLSISIVGIDSGWAKSFFMPSLCPAPTTARTLPSLESLYRFLAM